MKNKKMIICLLAFIAALVIASFVYTKLSKNYEPEQADIPQTEKVNKAPDFTVTDQNGQAVNLSDFNEKPVIVNFWATWCGPCKSEMPAFENLYKRYKDDVDIMMVNMTDDTHDTVERVKQFVSQNGFTFPVYFDTKADAANTYRVMSIPMTLFIDKNGNIVNTHTGAMTEKMLNNYIINLIGG